MTYAEVWEGVRSLSAADKRRMQDAIRQLLKHEGSMLRYGAKVQFKHSKTGAVISGTFVRMKQKYAEIMASQNQYGLQTANPIRWSVSPESLIPLTPDQAKQLGL